jgi:hypothetical protein
MESGVKSSFCDLKLTVRSAQNGNRVPALISLYAIAVVMKISTRRKEIQDLNATSSNLVLVSVLSPEAYAGIYSTSLALSRSAPCASTCLLA